MATRRDLMMSSQIEPDWLTRARSTLAEGGINLSGVASARDFPGWLDGAHSVVVFASGGPSFWQSFVASVAASPRRLRWRRHPLDAHGRELCRRADPRPGPDRRWVLCGALERHQPDFRQLAFDAGLGTRSRLGLLMNARYGPWVGLRMACFTREALSVDGPLERASPCDDCLAPCEAACPVGAVSEHGWDVGRCAAYHVESDRCREACHARDACPEGAAHRYPDLERLYHSDRRTGRRALARALGIRGGLPGLGPFYRPWARHGKGGVS